MGGTSPTATEQIVQAVATETGTDPLDLPPLYDTIDPDALDEFVRMTSDCTVSFEYADCSITVESSNAILVDGRPASHVSAEPSSTEASDG